MPDAARAAFRTAPVLVPGEASTAGFDIIYGVSTLHRRFAALASPDHTCRDLVPAFLQRSPRSLLTAAAWSGLRPAPDCRLRGVCPHLSYSSTPPLLCRRVRDTRRLRPLTFLAAS